VLRCVILNVADPPAPLDDDLPPTDYDVAAPIDKTSVPMPRFQHGAGSTPIDNEEDARNRVPLDPPHNCPHCHRGLGGIAGRFCPECNKPFDLESARLTGSELTAAALEDRRSIRRGRIQTLIGIALMVVAFAGPIMISPTKLRIWIMCVLDGTMAVLALSYKLFFDRPWAHATLVAGIFMVLFAGLLLLAT